MNNLTRAPIGYLLLIVLMGISSCTKSPPISTPSTSTVIDIDGNVYHTVVIGTQTWLDENLKTTHYRDGVAIPNDSNYTVWANDTTGAYCNYNNDTSNGNIYGHLYNWFAVNNPDSLCPVGWHIPTDSEWTVLTTYLGGDSLAGGAMKAVDTTLWTAPNTRATNSSGFAGLPAGYCTTYQTFYTINMWAYFWSSTAYNSGSALYRLLEYDNGVVTRSYFGANRGFSCRCVKN